MCVNSSATPTATATAPAATPASTPATSPVRALMGAFWRSARLLGLNLRGEARGERLRDVGRAGDDAEPRLPPGPRAQGLGAQLPGAAVGGMEGRQQPFQLRLHQARIEPRNLAFEGLRALLRVGKRVQVPATQRIDDPADQPGGAPEA